LEKFIISFQLTSKENYFSHFKFIPSLLLAVLAINLLGKS